jgi:uncharacterized protein (TIGR00251 family)
MGAEMIQESPKGVTLTVYVQPKAARTEYVGMHGGALRFRVTAPPVEGAANEALCVYLAERFGLPKSAVAVLAGQGSRRKRVLLRGVSSRQALKVFACQA